MTTENLRDKFQTDGVICLPQLLSTAELEIMRTAWQWSIDNPGRGATRLNPGAPGSFYGDLANPASFDPYHAANFDTCLAQTVASIWSKPDVWFMYEQVFFKTGGESDSARRTPWHQDLPYLPIEGNDLAVAWISFEHLSGDESLEFVRGSHRQTLYDGSKFDPADDILPLYGTGDLPRLPNIEADRKNWDIISFDVTPGDVVLFHPAMLHGGAPVPAGKTRRTLSLRYFGSSSKVAWRPGDTMEKIAKIGEGPNVHPMTLAKKAGVGAPFEHPGFPKVR